ncbi:ferredoxin [Mycobacterium sp. CBMA 234]|uniref:ferredoxin n=1 Tax=Mycolicibacterium sp. CBMA 234 TaxID=1918495 RepID=UPI0012DE0708|nr:ferredoxin [Mycolicibacterium sp. CBMA 234]MUL65844.1 ferredoxin [Mycolicibacterium sp. CBMA 234]
MKIIRDAHKCELHGECLLAAPDVFDIEDDAEFVTVLIPEPGEELRDAVERAVLNCPTTSLRIED